MILTLTIQLFIDGWWSSFKAWSNIVDNNWGDEWVVDRLQLSLTSCPCWFWARPGTLSRDSIVIGCLASNLMPRYGQMVVAQGWIGNLRAKLWYATPCRADFVIEDAICFGPWGLPVFFSGHASFVDIEDSFHARIKSIWAILKEREVFLFVESAAIERNLVFFAWVGAGAGVGARTKTRTRTKTLTRKWLVVNWKFGCFSARSKGTYDENYFLHFF